jgi:hypothetical protein
MMPEEPTGFMRRNPETGEVQVVNCPYDWIPISSGGYKLSLPRYTEACTEAGTPLCIGECCAIYPCERVRDFLEGRI